MQTCVIITFRNGEKCQDDVVPGHEYCILHIDLPENEGRDEFARLKELKEKKVKEKAGSGDFNFEGTKLSEIDLSGMEICSGYI